MKNPNEITLKYMLSEYCVITNKKTMWQYFYEEILNSKFKSHKIIINGRNINIKIKHIY